MDIVKKMQRDAMIAERYAKKKLDALKEIHKLRNLEISEMFSQYKDFNVDGDDDEFIETQSYLEILAEINLPLISFIFIFLENFILLYII